MGAIADSLLGSLCRESCWLRSRASQVQRDLQCCQNPGLCSRLRQELESLGRRRLEIQRLSATLKASRGLRDSLAVDLLDELCRRPLLCS